VDRPRESLVDLKLAVLSDDKFRAAARRADGFDNLRADPELGPQFERLVAEPEDEGEPDEA
jgi:hypothetical protein